MISNIIYILATLCLLIGSILTFNFEIADYFYTSGTSLFFVKSILCLVKEIQDKNKNQIYYEQLDY